MLKSIWGFSFIGHRLMQAVVITNKKVMHEWKRRKIAVFKKRKETKNKHLPLPKFGEVVNEYINKGFKFDPSPSIN